MTLIPAHAQLRSEDDVVRAFGRDGVAILHDLVSPEICDAVRHALEECPEFDSHKHRRMDLWKGSGLVAELVRGLACHEVVLRFLHRLYGRDPIPFQTLNFPVGTQQHAHSDHIHFSTIPAGWMCGVWIALEDIDAGNGPLFYYPGSHVLAPFDYDALGIRPDFQGSNQRAYREYEERLSEYVELLGYERRELIVPRGTALVWAANLVHGGSKVLRSGSTRWSQVTHYVFPGCLYYSPLSSDVPAGRYRLSTAQNIRTGEPLVSCGPDGEPLSLYPGSQIQRQLRGFHLESDDPA